MFSDRLPTSRFVLLLAMPMVLWLATSLAIAADISIVSPKSEETVHDNLGDVTVEISAELEPGQRIRLLIDNTRAAPDDRATTFSLHGVDRGEHRLKAQVLGKSDALIAESDAVIFFMWRASKLFPNR